MPDWAATHLPNLEEVCSSDVRFGSKPHILKEHFSMSSSSSSSSTPASSPPSSPTSATTPPHAPPFYATPSPPPKLAHLDLSFALSEATKAAAIFCLVLQSAVPTLRAELAALPALTSLSLSAPTAQCLLQHGVTAATAAVIGPHVTQLSITSTRRGPSVQGWPPCLATQFPRVQKLHLGGTLDDAAMEQVLALPCLQHLVCKQVQLTRSFVDWQAGARMTWSVLIMDAASFALLPLERIDMMGVPRTAGGTTTMYLTPTATDAAVWRVLWAMQRPGWQRGLRQATLAFVIGPATPAYSRARQREQPPRGPVLPAALVASAPLLAALPCLRRVELCGALHLDAATWEALWRAPAEGDGGDTLPPPPHACLREVELDDKCTVVPDAWAALLPALPSTVRKLTVKARAEPPGVSGPSSERAALARPPTAAQLEQMAAGAPRPVEVHVPGALAKAPAREWQGLCARVQAASGGRVKLKR